MKSVAAGLLVGLIVLGSVAVYQQVLISTSLRATQTTTVYSYGATSTVFSSGAPPQLLGSRGNINMYNLTSPQSTVGLEYFEANSTDQQSFYYRWTPDTRTYLSVNFSEYTPTVTAFVDFQFYCKYYSVTFQDNSSENLSVCRETDLPSATTQFTFTQHMDPQAGLAYSTNGVLYFLITFVSFSP